VGFDKNVGRLSIWATVCKTVRLVLSDRRLSVCLSCPVCNVGVLSPQGWTDQNETWYECRPRPWPHCIRWGRRSFSPKAHSPSIFGPCLLWPNGCMDQDETWHRCRPRPSPHCVRWAQLPLPPKKTGTRPPIFDPCLLWPNGRPSQLLMSICNTIPTCDGQTDGCNCCIIIVLCMAVLC